MTDKPEEPENMMDFILNTMNSLEVETAALIQPLPASVQPSNEFVEATRKQLLDLATEPREARAA